MRIFDNKAIMLNLRNPKQVTEVIPKSKAVDDHQVVVNWGLDEAKALRNMNINAPSPIEGRYVWTGKHEPFDHQKKTAAFMTMNRRSFCFNEQGTGKTASAIWAADFVIINYDGVEIVQDVIADGGFDCIIIDEATHYKNVQTKRWKTLKRIIKPDTWLWLMTGTPAAQSPLDAYGLAKLVNPNAVPKFFGSFRDQVMVKITQFKWVAKEHATDVVFNALQPAIRYTKDECLDLPPMVYVKREVELTRQQKKYYKQLRDKMVIHAAGEEVTAPNAAVVMSKLLQISCGAIYTDGGDSLEFDIKHRYKVLREVIDESSKKVLVFVPFKHVIDVLTNKLRRDGITTEIIRGDVPATQRTNIFKRFQENDNPKVLVIQPQSAAHGVTLTAANTVVWWGPTSSLETYAQANARVHRSGQDQKCTIVQLQGSTVEKRVYALLDNRINVHTKMIDLYNEIID